MNYYTSILFESNDPQAKDIKRIQDIITKSNGDSQKQAQLASTMAGKITDLNKLERRYNAAVQELGDDHPVTNEFKKALQAVGRPVSTASSAPQNIPDDDSFDTAIETSEESVESPLVNDTEDNNTDTTIVTDIDISDSIEDESSLQDYFDELLDMDPVNFDDFMKMLKASQSLKNKLWKRNGETSNYIESLTQFLHNISYEELIDNINSGLPKNIILKDIKIYTWADFKETVQGSGFRSYPIENIEKNSEIFSVGDYKNILYLTGKELYGPNIVSYPAHSEYYNYTVDSYMFIYQAVIEENGKDVIVESGITNNFNIKNLYYMEILHNPDECDGDLYNLGLEYNVAIKLKFPTKNSLEKDIIKIVIKSTKELLNFGLGDILSERYFEKIYKMSISPHINAYLDILCEHIQEKYPEFPDWKPEYQWTGWKIRDTKLDLSSPVGFVIAPILWYSNKKVAEYVQDRRRGGGVMKNPKWDILMDYSPNEVNAFKDLCTKIKQAIGLKMFKKCIVDKSLKELYIPWDVII